MFHSGIFILTLVIQAIFHCEHNMGQSACVACLEPTDDSDDKLSDPDHMNRYRNHQATLPPTDITDNSPYPIQQPRPIPHVVERMDNAEANVYKTCYCREMLVELDDEDADDGWDCSCCARRIHEIVNYFCLSEDMCPYYQITGCTHMVCSDCFNFDTKHGSEQKVKGSEPKNFISEKVLSTMNIMR